MAGPGATKYIMIDDFLIDCSLSESHSFDSDVTEFPVESGSNISDNIRPLPIVVDIEGFVSNTPIGLMRDERVITSQKPVETCYELLQAIRDEREPVTIQTSLRTYDNMALTRLNIPRGPGGADGLRFTASFKQIQYVTNVRTIRVSVPIAQGGTGKGKKSVSKPGNPNGTRLILIDQDNDAWFDPDLGNWRHSVDYTNKTAVAGDIATRVSRWNLYRGLPRNDLLSTPTAGFVDLTYDKEITALDKWKSIIAVPIANCILHNFVIVKPVGSDANNFNRTDAAR